MTSQQVEIVQAGGVTVGPGEVLIVHVKGSYTSGMIEELQRLLREIGLEKRSFIFMGEDIDLKVVKL